MRSRSNEVRLTWRAATQRGLVGTANQGHLMWTANPEFIETAHACVEPESKVELSQGSATRAQPRRRREIGGHQQAQRYLPRLQMAVLPQTIARCRGEHEVQLDRAEEWHLITQPVYCLIGTAQEFRSQPHGPLGIGVHGCERDVWRTCRGLGRTGTGTAHVREVSVRVRGQLAPWANRLHTDGTPRRRAPVFRASRPVSQHIRRNVDFFCPKRIQSVFQSPPSRCLPVVILSARQSWALREMRAC